MTKKNAVSVWITEKRIGQSGESDHEGGFLSVSAGCVIVLVNCFAAAVAVAVVAVYEDSACNSSSWGDSCCCCSHLLHHHAGSAHVGNNPALCP